MKITLLTLLASTVIATPALAYMHVFPGGGCMQENASINVNFNLRANSFADAKEKFDDKMKQMENFVKQQHVEKFTMQSMNYNVNSQHNFENNAGEGDYLINGNASYQLGSADDAFKLADFLSKQQFTVSVNVNRFGNGPCADNGAPPPVAQPLGIEHTAPVPPPPPPAQAK